jgi:hypothetical protein
MNNQVLESICSEIYRQFPEFKGILPKESAYENNLVLLVFNTKVKTDNGVTLPRMVRVVADQQGKIIKCSTSH